MGGLDLKTVWEFSPNDIRENIVAGMTSAKDTDQYVFGGQTAFGSEWGKESYRIIKNNNLLEK